MIFPSAQLFLSSAVVQLANGVVIQTRVDSTSTTQETQVLRLWLLDCLSRVFLHRSGRGGDLVVRYTQLVT